MTSVLPRAVRELSSELMKWPGVGPKSARRLAIYLLQQPRGVVAHLGDTLKNLHANVRVCTSCYNLSERDMCAICLDETRQQRVLCVVESALDVEAIERTDHYDGRYHVLGGVLSPLEGVSADQLTITELVNRLEREKITEIIFALNPSLEGEATVRHISELVGDRLTTMTRLGRGLPTGGDIEFADAVTLSAAFEGRRAL